MEIRAVRGMHDLYGSTLAAWIAAERQFREVLEAFGYQEIRTPTLEPIEVFTHTVGEDTDIVQKQMYQVSNEGTSEKLVLRPEGTAPFIRAVVEHGLHKTGHPQRYFYYEPMFRYERPQKGRLRQFHQWGAELINDASPEADAEILLLLDHLFKNFSLSEYEIRINSVGCADCRPKYRKLLTDFLQSKKTQLCELCQSRIDRAPMRVLDCKSESCQKAIKDAPLILAHLCEACRTHHDLLKEKLLEVNVGFIEDATIVRGLDYYTRTAFEFTSNLLGAQSALCGGGRYDGLATRFGEKPFPAIGFGLGMERMMLALETKGAVKVPDTGPTYYFAPLGDEAFRTLFRISISLKRQGVTAEIPYEKGKALKALLKGADRVGAKWAVILGDNEIKTQRVLLKKLSDGTQEEVGLAQLEEILLSRGKRGS